MAATIPAPRRGRLGRDRTLVDLREVHQMQTCGLHPCLSPAISVAEALASVTAIFCFIIPAQCRTGLRLVPSKVNQCSGTFAANWHVVCLPLYGRSGPINECGHNTLDEDNHSRAMMEVVVLYCDRHRPPQRKSMQTCRSRLGPTWSLAIAAATAFVTGPIVPVVPTPGRGDRRHVRSKMNLCSGTFDVNSCIGLLPYCDRIDAGKDGAHRGKN